MDFLLHDFGRFVKKVGVKTKDRALGRALINVQMSGFGGLSGNVLFGPSITVFDPERTSAALTLGRAQRLIELSGSTGRHRAPIGKLHFAIRQLFHEARPRRAMIWAIEEIFHFMRIVC